MTSNDSEEEDYMSDAFLAKWYIYFVKFSKDISCQLAYFVFTYIIAHPLLSWFGLCMFRHLLQSLSYYYSTFTLSFTSFLWGDRQLWELRNLAIRDWEVPFFSVVCVRNYWMIQMSANPF